MRILTAGLLLLVTGCAATSGIVPVGPNTYALSEMRAPVRGGGAEARRVVLAEADGFCQQQGRAFVPVDMRPDGGSLDALLAYGVRCDLPVSASW